MKTFYQVISAAIADIEEHGYDSQSRVERWLVAIRKAARDSMLSPTKMEAELKRTFNLIYSRMIVKGGVLKMTPGVKAYALDKVKPRLHAELQRRIMASSQLIKLNRDAMIEKTTQRFAGWATSIPIGGSDAVNKKETKETMRKALAQLPFEERRVMIDQGHKFTAALAEIVAVDNNAIAATWHSRWRVPGYDYRVDHKERDKLVYMVRGNWAQEKGLVKPGAAGYTDEITKPGEEIFCMCNYTFIFNLRDLPEDMLTAKGKDALNAVRIRK